MNVTVIDYGLGNIRSVLRAIEHVGGTPLPASHPSEISGATRIILPGVGAFADGMSGLKEKKFIEPLTAYLRSNKPFLGICLGMQMLFEEAEEFGSHQGLGIIPGVVKKIPSISQTGQTLKVPHIGWSPLLLPENAPQELWNDSIFSDTRTESFTYFIHSFQGVPNDPNHRLADTVYNGERILAAIRKGNIFGCQFHPEKSGPAGLNIIRNFLHNF